MELQETQEREIELKQVEALEIINEMLSEHDQPPLKLSWIKKMVEQVRMISVIAIIIVLL